MSNIVSNLSSSHLYSPSYYNPLPSYEHAGISDWRSSLGIDLNYSLGLRKELTEDEKVFNRIMDGMRKRLKTDIWANKQTWKWKEIATIYGLWDTKYHTDEEYKYRLFGIGGTYGYGYEANYYAMGMLMKHRGLMPWAAGSLVTGYKLFRWYELGATPSTWHFVWRGYNEYQGAAPWVDTNIRRDTRGPAKCILP